ncbi:hypothetical protein BD560DRAFT_392105 [Blakeslea trispora]|nr:hypothetical protein BD560DRAFT_392105 [Blakeslea trispora]
MDASVSEVTRQTSQANNDQAVTETTAAPITTTTTISGTPDIITTTTTTAAAPITSDTTSNVPIITTTTSEQSPSSTTTTSDVRPTNDPPGSPSSNREDTTTNRVPGRTTTSSSSIRLTSSLDPKTTPASITLTRAVTRLSAIPIISVSSSGSVVRTFTSTSFSTFVTDTPTVVASHQDLSDGSGSNTGAIAGGVVGGIAGLALIGAIVFILMKRRSTKQQTTDPYPPMSGSKHATSPPEEYNNYYENGSQYNTSTQGTKARPLVQAYDPATGYAEPQPYYYNNGYDPYYPQQNMMSGGRNVPDEIDYNTTTTSSGQRLSRHVPDEV